MEPISMLVAYALPTGRELTQRFVQELLAVQDEVSRRLEEFAHELEALRQSSWRAGRELLLEASADGWTPDERRALTERALERFIDGHSQLEGWDRVLCAVDASLTYRLLSRDEHARRWSLRAYEEGVEFVGTESLRRVEAAVDRVDREGDSLRRSMAKLKLMASSPATFNRQTVFLALVEKDPEADRAISTGVVESQRVHDLLAGNAIAASLMSLFAMEAFLGDLYDACAEMGCDLSSMSRRMLMIDLDTVTRTWEGWEP